MFSSSIPRRWGLPYLDMSVSNRRDNCIASQQSASLPRIGHIRAVGTSRDNNKEVCREIQTFKLLRPNRAFDWLDGFRSPRR
jgi:hypothetical protein